jgi:hypothetical protein
MQIVKFCRYLISVEWHLSPIQGTSVLREGIVCELPKCTLVPARWIRGAADSYDASTVASYQPHYPITSSSGETPTYQLGGPGRSDVETSRYLCEELNPGWLARS